MDKISPKRAKLFFRETNHVAFPKHKLGQKVLCFSNYYFFSVEFVEFNSVLLEEILSFSILETAATGEEEEEEEKDDIYAISSS